MNAGVDAHPAAAFCIVDTSTSFSPGRTSSNSKVAIAILKKQSLRSACGEVAAIAIEVAAIAIDAEGLPI